MKNYSYRVFCCDSINLNCEHIGTVIAVDEAEATKLLYENYLMTNIYVEIKELKEAIKDEN